MVMKRFFLFVITLFAASALFAQNAFDMLEKNRIESTVPTGLMEFKSLTGKLYINGQEVNKQEYYRFFDDDSQVLFAQGNKLIDLGGKFIGGGIGFALGWGLSSMVFKSDNKAIDDKVVYAICAGVAVIGVPITIAGHKKAQRAVLDYNTKNGYAHYRPELNLLVNPDGFGLAFRF